MIGVTANYLGGDEMVEIALKMGADPNCSLTNKVTPIFLAVKYGSPTTVQLLIDAGCDMHVVDCHGHTCLYNTIERCYPPVVKIILDHLPASEIYWTDVDSFGSEKKYSNTAIDWILRIYESVGSMDSITGAVAMDLHTSWKIIGKPTIDDICTTIILLRQKGCTFSPDNLQCIGRYFHGLPISNNSTAMAFKNEKKLLIRSIVVLYLPPTIRAELHATKIKENLKISQSNECVLNYECPICLESIDDPKREIGVTLYCGHVSMIWYYNILSKHPLGCLIVNIVLTSLPVFNFFHFISTISRFVGDVYVPMADRPTMVTISGVQCVENCYAVRFVLVLN